MPNINKIINSLWLSSPSKLLLEIKRKLFNKHHSADENTLFKFRCYFVLSTGRVGTQTIANLLSLSRVNDVYHEPYPLLYSLSKLNYKNELNDQVYELVREAFIIARKDLLEISQQFNKGYIETSPQVTFLAPVLEKLFPNSKFIHLIRNPYDVVRSGMRRGWFSGHPADETRITPLKGNRYYNLWPQMTPFEKNIWLWQETNSWIFNFFHHLPEYRKIIIKSEDIYDFNKEEICKISPFTNSPLPSENKIIKILNKKLNEQQTGEFPIAEEWTKNMKSKMVEIAGKTAKKFGYKLLD